MDYTYQYKEAVSLEALKEAKWDLFISAYSPAERVCSVFDAVSAAQKDWLLHREYEIGGADAPAGCFSTGSLREDEYIVEYAEQRLTGQDLTRLRVCVDITGFMRPHMLYLMHFLHAKQVRSFDVIYTEPSHYQNRDDTRFAGEHVHTVRQVAGYEGYSENSTKGDLLIINAGYEDRLTAEVAEDKDKARKLVLLGLPSLKADMYQQGLLRKERARDALGDGVREVFAPASDPFATATILSELVARERNSHGLTNLYLSPLSTKPAALGFALFYLRECRDLAASIIYPYSDTYAVTASAGIGRIWKYTVEFDT